MSALIFYLFLALFVSFICSLTESVLLSTPQTFLITIKDKEKWANSSLKFKSNIDRPLSAILSLNTVAKLNSNKSFGRLSSGKLSSGRL